MSALPTEPTLQDIAHAESRNAVKADAIPDSSVENVGIGLFVVRNDQGQPNFVDTKAPRTYVICSCKNWALSNPTRLNERGLSVRCKHVIKVQRMLARGHFKNPPINFGRDNVGESAA